MTTLLDEAERLLREFDKKCAPDPANFALYKSIEIILTHLREESRPPIEPELSEEARRNIREHAALQKFKDSEELERSDRIARDVGAYIPSPIEPATAGGAPRVAVVAHGSRCERLVTEGPRSYFCDRRPGHDGPCGCILGIEAPPPPAPAEKCPEPLPETAEQRSHRFNETTGALSWGRRSAAEHPDRCECQGNESTPHKHYDEAPFDCARCGCEAYRPHDAQATGTAEPGATGEGAETGYVPGAVVERIATIFNHRGIADLFLAAPCVFCGYNGEGYWQKNKHGARCPLQAIGGEYERALNLSNLFLNECARAARERTNELRRELSAGRDGGRGEEKA